MKYIEITIDLLAAGIEPVVAALMEMGITDTVVEDPRDIEDLMEKKQTYDWDYLDDEIIEKMSQDPKVKVYLEDTIENREKINQIEDAVAQLRKRAEEGEFGLSVNMGSLQVHAEFEDDSQWKDRWKEYFKPSRISERFVVKPTWEEYQRLEGDRVIEIDPGMAFGTGTHETTSMCVRALEKYVKRDSLVMDVGCGSGILSIAAAMAGSKGVLAIDIDPVAVEVTRENVVLNGVADRVQVMEGDLTKGVEFRGNIVVANLMADLVVMLAESVAAHLLPGGYFISSGILEEKEEQVESGIKAAGFVTVEIMRQGGWCCIVARPKCSD